MSTISSSFAPQSAASQTSPTQSIDKQIQALEKRLQDAVNNGSLTQAQATDITKKLDAIKQQVDQGGTSGSLSTADLRDISRMLHHLGRMLAHATQANATATSSGATDTDGDNDGSGSTATNNAVGLSASA